MSFPDEIMPGPIATEAATELLTLLDGCPTGEGLRNWLSDLRGSARDAQGQDAMFGMQG